MSDDIFPVTMPKWGMEMTEGRITAWLVEEGDAISKGDDIVEVETEKVVSVCEAAYEGTLRRRLAEEDETRPVGDLLAVIADADATDAEVDAFIENYKPAGTVAEQPRKSESAEVAKTAPEPAPAAAADAAVSPMAQRYAARHAIDLSTVQGTGRGGRISLDDVKAAQAGGTAGPGKPEA